MPFDPNAAAPIDSGIFGLPDEPDEAKVILFPVPWDATTSYRPGTSDGPRAILAASKQVDLFDIEVGRPYEAGIAMLAEDPELRAINVEARALAVPVIAAGGDVSGNAALAEKLARVNVLSDVVNRKVFDVTRRWLDRGKIVGLVGGDHASPFGAIQAHAERYPGMGILHVDAHADLRREYEGFAWSHASIMENVARRIDGVSTIVQVGIRDLCEEEHRRIEESGGRIRTHFDVDIARARMRGELGARIASAVSELPRDVYVSFDIDGLDPVLCPATGTPVPGGLSFHEAAALLREVATSGKRIVGFDLNEVGGAEWDGNVGARLLYKLIGWTLVSRGISRPFR